jgi:hypothetical protein
MDDVPRDVSPTGHGRPARVPVLLDTDIGTDIDDIVLYDEADPDVLRPLSE